MPLASDARPGGETIAGKGKGAIRWTAPMVNTRRPEEPRGERRRKSALDTGRSATSARERAASTTAAGGGARVRDLASTTWSPRPADDGDDFNESLVELAEEYERELSFEASNGGRGIANATTSRARVANGADDASRTVIGSMIRRFREAPAAGESPRRRGTRSTEEDDEDDFDDYDRRDEREGFAFSTSQTKSPPERDDARDPLPSDDLVDELIASVSALRDGRRAPFFSASPTPGASSSRRRVGGGANASSEADVSRETWRSSSDAGGGSRGDDEWWFDAPDATDVSTASESGRGGRGGGSEEEEEEEDILESWRRRRRLEAATKGAAASPAARAAAAVAALDRVGPVDDDEYQTIVAAARAKLELVASDVESGDAATATRAASAATATTTTTATTATTTEPPREFDPPAWARKVDAAVATSASLELVNDATTDAAAAAESPRARRSLEFESRRDAAKTRAAADDDRRERERERERERDASGAASTSDSDPSSPSSCRDDRDRGPDISDALGNVVGDMLFGGEDADDDGWSNPGLMMFPSTRGAAAGAKPPRPAPPRPPR